MRSIIILAAFLSVAFAAATANIVGAAYLSGGSASLINQPVGSSATINFPAASADVQGAVSQSISGSNLVSWSPTATGWASIGITGTATSTCQGGMPYVGSTAIVTVTRTDLAAPNNVPLSVTINNFSGQTFSGFADQAQLGGLIPTTATFAGKIYINPAPGGPGPVCSITVSNVKVEYQM